MKKIINKYITASIVSICMVLGVNTSVNAGEYGFQKIVYHVNYDTAKRQGGALRNIQNHINAVGKDNMDLRVIMHGKGLSMLLLPEEAANTKLPRGNATEALTAKIAGLKDQGVKFKVCANTLKGKKITLEQLYDAEKSDIVTSGVAELAHLQAQGFTYIKP
jgi:intracellular sulfur oxidation DsrE/DsrF family protein